MKTFSRSGKSVLVLICLCCLSGSQCIAQEINKQILNQFIGEWKGEGALFGRPAKFQLEFAFVLNEKFLHLKFRNEYSIESKDYVMDARAYYAIGQDSLSGYWFDSRGIQLPVIVGIDEKSLTSLWGSKQEEQGKTVYSLEENGELLVTDYVMRNGAYTKFGTAKYMRLK